MYCACVAWRGGQQVAVAVSGPHLGDGEQALLDGVVRDGVDEVAQGDARLQAVLVPAGELDEDLRDNVPASNSQSLPAAVNWPGTVRRARAASAASGMGFACVVVTYAAGHVQGHHAGRRGEGDEAGAGGEGDAAVHAPQQPGLSATARPPYYPY